MTHSRGPGRLVSWGGLVLCLVAALEATSYLAIHLLNDRLVEPIRRRADIYREQTARLTTLIRTDTGRLLQLDSALGWRYRANHADPVNRTDRQDLRGTKDYRPSPGRGVTRLAAFGDSFVYGNEVATEDSWPALIEAMDPKIEVLNYGVGGYGTDQAYLRYRAEGRALRPSVVVIGFVPDDIRRVLNVYRRFLSSRELPLTKPRFVLVQGRLELVPNPLPDSAAFAPALTHPDYVRRLGLHDHWYEPSIYGDPVYDLSATVRLLTGAWIRLRNRFWDPDRVVRDGVLNERSHAFGIQMTLFERFAADARDAGAKPVVVLFPDRETLIEARRTGRRVFAPVLAGLSAAQVATIDLTDVFLEAGAAAGDSVWFMPGGHYSPRGNRLVAESLIRALRSCPGMLPVEPCAASPA